MGNIEIVGQFLRWLQIGMMIGMIIVTVSWLCIRVENRTCVLCVFCWGGMRQGGWANNIHLHLRTCITLPYSRFSCTCTHASRYAILLHLHACVTLRCCRFSCTCTHASRYARLLHLHACVTLRCCRFSCTCTKKNNPDWMTWFGDMFAHGNGAGKQMLLDLSFKIIRSLHCQDLNFTSKTRWRCGFGHEGWRKGSFLDMQFIQNMQ